MWAQGHDTVMRAQAVSEYVSRGRRLEHTPDRALEAAWISLRRARATTLEQENDTRLLGIESEYSLRGIEPPYEFAQCRTSDLRTGGKQGHV